MTQPLLSVIIPVYNAQSTLKHCVESVLRQTYSPLEIILVDDGSKDLSGELCDILSSEDDRIIAIHQENQGPNSARNNGIANAHGEFITFVDADDEFYTPETLTDNMLLFNKDRLIDIVSFPQYIEEYNHSGVRELIIKNEQFVSVLLENKREIFINWFNGRLIDGAYWGKIFRKSLFDGWKLIETIRFTEDHYEIPNICSRCNKVQISGIGGYVYKYNETSAIHSEYTPFKRYGQLLSELKIYSYLLEFSDVAPYKKQFYLKALENAYYLIDTIYEGNALDQIKILQRRVYKSKSVLLNILMIFALVFGFRYGLKLSHSMMNSFLRRLYSV